jgi:hypothetical protein
MERNIEAAVLSNFPKDDEQRHAIQKYSNQHRSIKSVSPKMIAAAYYLAGTSI